MKRDGGQREGPAASFTSKRKRGKKGYLGVHLGTGGRDNSVRQKEVPDWSVTPSAHLLGGHLSPPPPH